MDKVVCSKCNIEKELTTANFGTYVYKGKSKWYKQCKACKNAYKKLHYERNKEPYLARSRKQREYNHDEYLRYLREYYAKNKETLLEKSKARIRTPKGREQGRQRCARYRQKPLNKQKEQCRGRLNYALKKGYVVRPTYCSTCQKACKPEAHHTNYLKPFEVTWLCKRCHEAAHHLNEGSASSG